MADQEEPVYFDRNRDSELAVLIADLRKDLDALDHLARTFPRRLADLGAIRADVVELSNRSAEEKLANRTRPVQIDRRRRPDLVVFFGARYDVVLDEGSYRSRRAQTLRNVELSKSANTWQYASGRSVALATGRIVEIRPADPSPKL